MRFNINLASQPYEAARQFRRRMGVAVAVLAIIGAVMVGYIVYQRIHSRAINRQLSETHQEIERLNQEEAQARAILNRPENRDVADQSQFLNDLFARKALSWTRIFGEMERIVPPELHVVSMKPEYTKTNDLMLRVVVATGSLARAVELVRRMEKSNHFRQAEIVNETVTANLGDQSAGPGNIQFDIAAIYLPNAPDNETVEDKSAAASPPQKAASAAKPAIGVPAANLNPPAVRNLTPANPQQSEVRNRPRPRE